MALGDCESVTSQQSTSFRAAAACPRQVVIAALALALLACGDARERPRNLLLVSLDTVRADRLGCYGRANAGTPKLDALASKGTRFSDVTAPGPVTLPSHATLFTGLEPTRHRVRHNSLFALSPQIETLAQRLARAGFRTGGFVGSVVLAKRHGLARGFESYTAPGLKNAPALFFLSERPATVVNADALAWIDSIQGAAYFLFVHYMEAHAPYLPPEPLRARFAHDPYQGEIAAADHAFGMLLQGLAERGQLQDTLVLVVADHGESLGEHGERTHGIFLYQATLHVPMLAAGPGVLRGQVVDAPVGLVDVTPTLLDAVGLEVAEELDGRSLWPALGGARLSATPSLYAESFLPRLDYGWSPLRALRSGGFKYIAAPRPELYALTEDPNEDRDLGQVEPERAADLSAALAVRVAQREMRGASPVRLELGDAERRALETLGYLSGLHEGSSATKLADPKDKIALSIAMDRISQLLQANEYSEAEARLREMLAANDTLIQARVRLITALMGSDQRHAAVVEAGELARAAQQLPHGQRVAARAHMLMGQVHFEAGRLAEAASEYERALVAPQPPELYDMLARIYLKLGRRGDSLRILRRVEERGDATEDSRALLTYLSSSPEQSPPESTAPE